MNFNGYLLFFQSSTSNYNSTINNGTSHQFHNTLRHKYRNAIDTNDMDRNRTATGLTLHDNDTPIILNELGRICTKTDKRKPSFTHDLYRSHN